MYLIRELTDLSLPEIGVFLGAKHHTTILHAYKKIKEYSQNNTEISNIIHKIIHSIKSE
jgi:chromosomal replication initiator protein